MQDERWRRWTDLVGGARTQADLDEVLARIAAELSAPRPPWTSLGVEVQRRPLVGRLGGIVQRGGRRIVLIDASLAGDAADFVTAHELAHLVLSYSRGPVVGEEALCDVFAERVTGARSPLASVGSPGHCSV